MVAFLDLIHLPEILSQTYKENHISKLKKHSSRIGRPYLIANAIKHRVAVLFHLCMQPAVAIQLAWIHGLGVNVGTVVSDRFIFGSLVGLDVFVGLGVLDGRGVLVGFEVHVGVGYCMGGLPGDT